MATAGPFKTNDKRAFGTNRYFGFTPKDWEASYRRLDERWREAARASRAGGCPPINFQTFVFTRSTDDVEALLIEHCRRHGIVVDGEGARALHGSVESAARTCGRRTTKAKGPA